MSEVKASISTSSQEMAWKQFPPPAPPQIKLNGVALPAPSSSLYWPTGFQVVVIDSSQDITNPNSILTNEYQLIESTTNTWMYTYTSTYDNIMWQVLSSGNLNDQLVFIASFGLDVNMAPPNSAYEFWLELGAGEQLQAWETGVDIGSQQGNDQSWVSIPGSYILIGGSNLGYGGGEETYSASSGTTTLAASIPNTAVSS